MEALSIDQLLHDVLTSRVYDVARETSLDPAARLSRRLGQRVFFAGEATEPVEYGTVHAALWSGEQAAEAIWRAACGVEAGRQMRPWSGARQGAGQHNR